MLANFQNHDERLDLEGKVLAAAFKQSFESGDKSGAALAHKGLCAILQQKLFGGAAPAALAPPSQASVSQLAVAGPAPDVSAPEATESRLACPPASCGEITSAPLPEVVQEHPGGEETVLAGESGLTPESELPAGGPIDYLDFGAGETVPASDDSGSIQNADASTGAIPADASERLPEAACAQEGAEAGLAQSSPISQAQPINRLELSKSQTFYELLNVNKLSSFEEIHTSFFRLIRKLLTNRLRQAETSARELRDFREYLRGICIAHDILKDPVTRTDYDLRMLGLRTSLEAQVLETPEDAKGSSGSRTRLMLGELLECARILEPTELEIALDMHKAEPGQPFGQFLVKAGFLTQDELDAAVLGQRMISAGKITIAQFRVALSSLRENGVSFLDTLMIEGWIQPKDIFSDESELWQQSVPSATPQIVEIEISADRNEEALQPKPITLGAMSPGWADNLVWGDAEEAAQEQGPEPEQGRELDQELESAQELEREPEKGQEVEPGQDQQWGLEPGSSSIPTASTAGYVPPVNGSESQESDNPWTEVLEEAEAALGSWEDGGLLGEPEDFGAGGRIYSVGQVDSDVLDLAGFPEPAGDLEAVSQTEEITIAFTSDSTEQEPMPRPEISTQLPAPSGLEKNQISVDDIEAVLAEAEAAVAEAEAALALLEQPQPIPNGSDETGANGASENMPVGVAAESPVISLTDSSAPQLGRSPVAREHRRKRRGK